MVGKTPNWMGIEMWTSSNYMDDFQVCHFQWPNGSLCGDKSPKWYVETKATCDLYTKIIVQGDVMGYHPLQKTMLQHVWKWGWNQLQHGTLVALPKQHKGTRDDHPKKLSDPMTGLGDPMIFLRWTGTIASFFLYWCWWVNLVYYFIANGPNTHAHIFWNVYSYIYIYVCICICMYICIRININQ